MEAQKKIEAAIRQVGFLLVIFRSFFRCRPTYYRFAGQHLSRMIDDNFKSSPAIVTKWELVCGYQENWFAYLWCLPTDYEYIWSFHIFQILAQSLSASLVLENFLLVIFVQNYDDVISTIRFNTSFHIFIYIHRGSYHVTRYLIKELSNNLIYPFKLI